MMVCLLGILPMKASAEMEIDYVSWYYKPEYVFKRIAEYFGAPEQTGSKILLRSQPGDRAGLYFVTHLSEGAGVLPSGSAFVLAVIFPDSPRARTYRFPLPEPIPDYAVAWLGLTGADLPADEAPPVAWHLQIEGADGTVLADKKSYLWEYEASPAESP